MEKEEIVAYWVEMSEKDAVAMRDIYQAGQYSWSLFIGHLSVEKMIKAIYITNHPDGMAVIKSHDLVRLAKEANIEMSETKLDILDRFTTFNIAARYPDYKLKFYKDCTREYTKDRIIEIDEVLEWLRKMINKE